MSLGTKCNFYRLECCPYFRIRVTSYLEDCLMCCPYNKVIKSDPKKVSSTRGVTRRHVMPHFTSDGTDQSMPRRFVKLPYSISRATSIDRTVVAYLRLAFSATKRTNHAPISFDQQAQVSHGHTSCRNKENRNTEAMVMEVFSW